ncbi:hypothetical protein EVAR_96041_1 [Eumeta japonica]|uniref:Uncharacterized protein n=1 Tax=Eumeta variegata TaxID=151549 RepID=A0A4C1W6T8_EUMVA|nr:hypothetical protein EVAR_96041_1 [Eumeta japonica]
MLQNLENEEDYEVINTVQIEQLHDWMEVAAGPQNINQEDDLDFGAARLDPCELRTDTYTLCKRSAELHDADNSRKKDFQSDLSRYKDAYEEVKARDLLRKAAE